MKQGKLDPADRLARGLGYDKTHITRTLANRAVEGWLGRRWTHTGWRRASQLHLANHPDFPAAVWAIARKPE